MIAFDELRKILVLEDVSDSMLGKMVPLLQMRVFGERDVIFQQGDDADLFYMLKEGKVLLEVDASESISISLGAMKTGFSFGWSSLFSGSNYTSTAVCVEPTEVIALPGKDLVRLMDENHDNGYGIMWKIAAILRRRLGRRTGQFLRAIEQHPDIQKIFQADFEGPPEFFANIFLNSPIGIFIIQDGKFVFANPEFCRISGFNETELLRMKPLDIVQRDDKAHVRESAIKMLKGEVKTPYEHRILTKQNDAKWIIETVIPINYEGRRAVLGYFMDNTNAVHTQEALSITEDKFQKAFRSSPDWFVISTLEGGFYIDVNEAFLWATGYTKEEILGKSAIDLGIWVHPEQRHEMLKTLKKEGVVRNLEVEFRMKSGEIRQMLWSAEAIDYGDEKCLIAATRDITDRVRAQKEQLGREKLEGVLEIAGATCHEINQPLQYMYLVLNEAMKENPDSKNLQEIKKQCDRIKEITQKMESITVCETTEYVGGKKMVDIYHSAKNGVCKIDEPEKKQDV
ncbi:MAG: PAS domain S-box protein [Deltaproteobacteria bacterium]|nr:PAS domain S-box protein [Deltaproteobacteria bacterium]